MNDQSEWMLLEMQKRADELIAIVPNSGVSDCWDVIDAGFRPDEDYEDLVIASAENVDDAVLKAWQELGFSDE